MERLTKPIYDTSFSGDLVKLGKRITDNWLLGLRESNPALIDMFVCDDDMCVRDKLSWSGEFPGKYITSCVYIYRLTHDKRLLSYAVKVADELVSCQKENGYLGVWGKDYQLTGYGRFVNGSEIVTRLDTWDSWSHYHIMYGLILLYDETKDEKYLSSAIKIADLFCKKFYTEDGLRLGDTGCLFANLAPIHIMAYLYNRTKNEKYLSFALEAEKDIAHPDAIDFVNNALAGNEYYKCRNVPRWEYIHSVEAMAELYYATGDEKYKDVFVRIWDSIERLDVHNTGAFSTFEQAMGTPYIYDRAIETCCVVAHTALTVDMLGLTNDARAADQLERALYNTTLGSFNPTGRWATYSTPMCGYKKSHYHEIEFQCKPGAPELNCCSVNAPRPLGTVTEWAYREGGDGVYVNFYGSSKAVCKGLEITQKTAYPYKNTVDLRVAGCGKVYLRIPEWSKKTKVCVNGCAKYAESGYFEVDCVQTAKICLTFDFSLRFEEGREMLEGKKCVFCGPMLLCYDKYYTDEDASVVFGKTPKVKAVKRDLGALYEITTDRGNITLCDMINAGVSGSYYTTWM